MSCFPCFSKSKSKSRENSRSNSFNEDVVVAAAPKPHEIPSSDADKKEGSGNIEAQSFTFRELASATRNFRPDCLLGEGGFGRVYKGVIESTGQDVAIKQLDRNGMQGNKEFLTEVLTLSLLHHTNLVNLIGYCADGDQRLLVYEFMSLGSLDKHLFDLPPDRKPLNWYTRMKIATGAATGLEYLHDKANPPIIYRDLKSANILLNEEHTAKISDFGLAKLGLMGDSNLHAASMVMGTYGYCAPEYAKSGELTLKSDVYSFGVLMLELITGRRAMDPTKPANEQNLVAWAQPMFKDQKRFPELVDPLLGLNYPVRDLNQAVAVAAMCLQEESMVRPLMADVVITLSFLQCQPPASEQAPPAPKKTKSSRSSSSDSSEDEEEERKKAVAKAIEWGSMEREHQRSQQEDGSESESESESEAGEEEEAESE